MNVKRVALVIGHTVGADKGAYSPILKTAEQPYWLDVANRIKAIGNCKVDIYDVYTHSIQPYYEREKALADKINKSGIVYDAVLELHFNSASPLAHGTECLYWFGSKKGIQIAQQISNIVAKDLGMTLRGVNGSRALVNKNDRGYWFVYLQKYPAVITELFFGTNEDDCKIFENRQRVAEVLNKAILNLNL